MNKKNLGIREIAELAGVSVATVSRVINTPEKATAETCKKVTSIIQQYHYVPNLTARNLFSCSSNSFALFLYDLTNPFFVSLADELGKIALEKQYSLLICNTENDPQREREYIQYCDTIRTRGIILTEGCLNEKSFENTNQKLVFLDRKIDGDHSLIRSDNEKGITNAVDYLYNLDHRRIAFAGYYTDFGSCSERFQAFANAMEQKGLPLPEEYRFFGPPTAQTGVDACDQFCALRNKPTAVMCVSDVTALGFCMRATQFGFSIPNDFSVIGFDGCLPDYYYPRITTIRQNIRQLSHALIDAVFTENEEPVNKILDVSLALGDSCRKI